MGDFSGWAGCEGEVFGVHEPTIYGQITWKVRSKNGTLRMIDSEAYPDDVKYENSEATGLTISCNRPWAGGDDVTGGGVPYRYVMLSRTPFK